MFINRSNNIVKFSKFRNLIFLTIFKFQSFEILSLVLLLCIYKFCKIQSLQLPWLSISECKTQRYKLCFPFGFIPHACARAHTQIRTHAAPQIHIRTHTSWWMLPWCLPSVNRCITSNFVGISHNCGPRINNQGRCSLRS